MMRKTMALAVVGAMLAGGCGQMAVTTPQAGDQTFHAAWYGSWGFGGTPPATGLGDYLVSRTATPSVTGYGGGVLDWNAYYPTAGLNPGFGSFSNFGYYATPIYANNAGVPFTGPYAFGASVGYPFSPWRVF